MLTLQCFFPAEGEKVVEEKNKEATAEATDTKDKSEVSDMKKGTSYFLPYDAAPNTKTLVC